jgi:hypothetical protein
VFNRYQAKKIKNLQNKPNFTNILLKKGGLWAKDNLILIALWMMQESIKFRNSWSVTHKELY